MTFPDFKTQEAALIQFGLSSRTEDFIQPVAHQPPAWLEGRLALVRRLAFPTNESGTTEGLVFPVLLEAWEPYAQTVKVWPKPTFGTDDLYGVPDYVVTRVPNQGYLIFQAPYAVIVEAKQEKWSEGWGQCIAAMVAAQRLNAPQTLPIYGAVTIGHDWQFAYLDGEGFTLDSRTFSLAALDRLIGAIRYLFEQAQRYPVPGPLRRPA